MTIGNTSFDPGNINTTNYGLAFVSKWAADGTHEWLVPVLAVADDPDAGVSPRNLVVDGAGSIYLSVMVANGMNWTGTAIGSLVPGNDSLSSPFVAKFSSSVSADARL
jgi:hypothetical protein